ncbi:alcohol dehydrogenase catalytic domain-containing protein [Dactylosporangium sp. NBC_01737]|uniref:alcohol dehydrogenase catalytic domain-containing protein n=1 Tax=Dactylosporangium sp. NBC_01737 TaxID=2975959 RepID=UPI002E1513F1|nr:alcohol dehydrogenase catalytic domain-containing protein [Dactylosporangium sp. NBC_01737]
MRAVWWRAVGPPSVLEPGEAPEPVPGPDEVLIRVEAAGITFIETQTRAGKAPKAGAVPPAVLGNGVGGTVAEVGAGGDPALVGRRVVASLNGTGGYAELAVAAARNVVPIPDGVATLDATALITDGRTALGLHELAAPRPGRPSSSRRPRAAWAACWSSWPSPPAPASSAPRPASGNSP